MPTSAKRLPIFLVVGILLVLLICGALLSARPSTILAQTPAATTAATAALPSKQPVVTVAVGDAGTPVDGVAGEYCWFKADGAPDCNFPPEVPTPTASISVTAQDTLKFTLDPAEPAPVSLHVKGVEDSGPSQTLDLDLLASNGEVKGADLPDGKYRLEVEATYAADAQGNEPYVTYVFLIEKASAAVTQEATGVSATAAPTESSNATVEAPTAEITATEGGPTPEEVTPTSEVISATEQATSGGGEASPTIGASESGPTEPPGKTPTDTPAPPTDTPTPIPPTDTPTPEPPTLTPTRTPVPFVAPTATPIAPAPGAVTVTPAPTVTVIFSIEGTVYDAVKSTDTFVGIPGVTVVGIFGGNGVIASTKTDDTGRYLLTAKANSDRLDISLDFSAPGYQSTSLSCQASGPVVPEENATYTAVCNAGLQALPPTEAPEGPTATLFVPGPLPSFTPTLPTKVPVITATAGAPVTPTPQPTPIAPLATITVGGRVYEPIAINACVSGASGVQTCVTRPYPATLDRILAAANDVAQIDFKGPKPTSVTVALWSADGIKLVGSQSVPADNLTLYTMPGQAGSYVLSVEVVWPDGRATYLFRLVVGS